MDDPELTHSPKPEFLPLFLSCFFSQSPVPCTFSYLTLFQLLMYIYKLDPEESNDINVLLSCVPNEREPERERGEQINDYK